MAHAENGLIKMISMIGVGAQISVKPILVLIWGNLLTTSMAVLYFRLVMILDWRWSLLPLYLIILPMIGLVFYWFALDGLSRLPKALLDSKDTFAILQDRYYERIGKREIKGLGPVALTRRILFLGGLLWDSRDVIDTASNLYSLMDLFNPLFWLFMMISLISVMTLSSLYVIVCGGHYLFF